MLIQSILEFLFFSFLGWAIDSGYRSYQERKWINAGYFQGPVCPIYGFGALTLIFIFKYFSDLPHLILIFLGTTALILVEFMGGLFSETVLKVKLWDYSSSRFNWRGHIDLLHSFYWLISVIFFSFLIYPSVIYWEKLIQVPEFLEIPAFLIFVFSALWLTIRKEPARYLEIKEKFANLSLDDYQKIFSNIRKMQQTKSEKMRLKLEQLIQTQLRNSGAYLKKLQEKK